jgi:tetratricopeptide (TPR) repeat protein
MKHTIFSMLGLGLALLFAWQCANTSIAEKAPEIPELLTRKRQIGPDGEAASVLSLYESLVQQIKNNPNDVVARLSLTELFMQEARISGEHGHYYPAALQVVEGVLSAQKLNPVLRYRALLDKASVQLSQHQFAEARKTGEAALRINATEAGIYGVLVDANVELGDYAKAVEMADRMIAIRPDIRSYSRVSYLREIHGQVPGAIEAMKLAVAAGYPGLEQTEWARLTLGGLYERYGQLDSAMFHYNVALSARPNYPFALAALAQAKAKKGDKAEAEKLLLQACDMIPEVGFYVDWAMMEQAKGNQAKVEALTKDILAMLEDDVRSGHSMDLEYANLYLNLLGKPEQALPYAQKEYALRPENIDVNRLLAQIHLKMGQRDKAAEHLAKALRTQSKDPDALAVQAAL